MQCSLSNEPQPVNISRIDNIGWMSDMLRLTLEFAPTMVKSNERSPRRGPGPLAGVPFDKMREILDAPVRMAIPRKAASLAARLGVDRSDGGSLPVIRSLLQLGTLSFTTREWTGRAASFSCRGRSGIRSKRKCPRWCPRPSAGWRGKRPSLSSAQATVHVQSRTVFFTHGDCGVQLRNGPGYPEFAHAVRTAMDRVVGDGGTSMEVGGHYIRALILMAGWFIHRYPGNMTVKNGQAPRFVQRDASDTPVPSEWQLGLARFLADGPDSLQGPSGS